MIDLLFLLIGLALLVGGADLLVRGVAGLARAAGVPAVVIGLTVVAFGTSTPELVLGLVAASQGETSLTFGNVVGANAINVGVVLALTALLRPIEVERSIITREIPMMLLASTAALVLALDPWLGTEPHGRGVWSRGDGIMLLLLFCVFLYYTILDLRKRRATDPFVEEVREQPRRPLQPVIIQLGIAIAGLVGVSVGARLAVSGATSLARNLGIAESILGLTIVSLGTTLPELVTGLTAVRRGHGDIAIGNVVGSNIYNLLCIGGAVAVVRPIPVPQGGQWDLVFVTLLSALLLPLAIRGPRRIQRDEATVLLIAYLGYITWRTVKGA